jgi:hypothetical protein
VSSRSCVTCLCVFIIRLYYMNLLNILVKESSMEIRTQHIVNKSLLRLIIKSSSLILKDNIVVPSIIYNVHTLVTQSEPSEYVLANCLPSFHAKITFLSANIQQRITLHCFLFFCCLFFFSGFTLLPFFFFSTFFTNTL